MYLNPVHSTAQYPKHRTSKDLYTDSFLDTTSHNSWESHLEHEELIVVVETSVKGHSIEYALCTQEVVIRLRLFSFLCSKRKVINNVQQ